VKKLLVHLPVRPRTPAEVLLLRHWLPALLANTSFDRVDVDNVIINPQFLELLFPSSDSRKMMAFRAAKWFELLHCSAQTHAAELMGPFLAPGNDLRLYTGSRWVEADIWCLLCSMRTRPRTVVLGEVLMEEQLQRLLDVYLDLFIFHNNYNKK
jgi:hypothetical protein